MTTHITTSLAGSGASVEAWLRARDALPVAPAPWAEAWDSDWGRYLPAEPHDASARLRVALFSGGPVAHHLLHGLRGLATVSIVGIATDDLIDPRARISRRRRFWRHVTPAQAIEHQVAVELTALHLGVPVFTGDAKSGVFRAILDYWMPDVMLMCCFGQLLPRTVFSFPRFGAYNFHPSDLARGEYRGPTPYEDATTDGLRALPTSCHHVDAGFDTGSVVGLGPPVSLLDAEGRHLPVFDQLEGLGAEVRRMSTLLLTAILERRAAIERLDFV